MDDFVNLITGLIFTSIDFISEVSMGFYTFKDGEFAWVYKQQLVKKSMRGTCGARTRKGTPCQAPPVWNRITDAPANGRCKLHGGLSTGAKTEAGRQAIRDSNRRRAKNKAPSVDDVF